MLTHMLEPLRCRIIEAQDGQQAVELYQQHQPDLILLDISMPVLDGFGACQRIRAMPGSDFVPILMVTSFDDGESIERAFAVGATDYITKPIQRTVTQHRVRHWLRARRAELTLARRNNLLERVNQAASAASASLELPEILAGILRVAGEALGVTSARITRYDPHTDSVTVLADYSAPTASPLEQVSFVGRTDPISQFEAISAWVRNPHGSFLLIQMDEISLTETERAYYSHMQVKTALLAPFHTVGNLFGYLEFWDTQRKRHYSHDEIELVQAITNQVAASIANAQLYAALRDSENELRRYAKELEARNQELDAYNHTIAHDLKGPLTLILSYAAFVEEDGEALSDAAKLYLQRIQQYSREMAAMIEQLLMLATLHSSHETVKTVDVGAIMRIVLQRFQDQIEARQIKVELIEPIPPALGYEVWVQEVLANLIGNAIKYTDAAKPRITLSATRQDRRIRYNVQDNGIGIARDDQAKLFKIFTRLSQRTADGHGLGLSIVKGLVEKMNGEVGVESNIGEGSIFWFTLPSTE